MVTDIKKSEGYKDIKPYFDGVKGSGAEILRPLNMMDNDDISFKFMSADGQEIGVFWDVDSKTISMIADDDLSTVDDISLDGIMQLAEKSMMMDEALKNYQLKKLEYDKNANLGRAVFTTDLEPGDKASLKKIIIDTFGVAPSWPAKNEMVLNIPEKDFNNLQKLLILDLHMKIEGVGEAKVDRLSFKPVGVMMKDFKESWSTREMNRESKLVPDGEWVDVETGGDSDMMVCVTPEMKKALPKDDSLFAFTVGELMWDQDKNDFVTILTNNDGSEQVVWLEKGEGLEEIEKFMDANSGGSNESKIPVLESMSSVIKRISESAVSADGQEIQDGDLVEVTNGMQHEGEQGTVVEPPNGSFVIVDINGENFSFHASDLLLVDEEEEEDGIDEGEYQYVVDLDERGDYQAHIEDSDGKVVYEISGIEELTELVEDGFMKHKDDVDGLIEHLIDVGVLPEGAYVNEAIDLKINKYIKRINEDFGDDDQLALDNSEPEYEVEVVADGPSDEKTVQKIAQKLGIEGSPSHGFIVATKVLLRKFINTLKGFEIAVNKIIDGKNQEVALASILPYKPVGRPTNKYNYPNRMREAKTVNEEKLIKGADLTPEQKKMILAQFGYRNTKENDNPRTRKILGGAAKFDKTDDEWIADHAFWFTNDGSRTSNKRKHAEPSYLADDQAYAKYSTPVDEAFREGTDSHFASLLKEWGKKYGVEHEWEFKDVRGKTKSYFTLDLDFDGYDALPTDAKTSLNGLMKKFGVDFRYSNKNWTPIIESVDDSSEEFKDTEGKTPKVGDFIAYENGDVGKIKSFSRDKDSGRMEVDFRSHHLELNPKSTFTIIEPNEKMMKAFESKVTDKAKKIKEKPTNSQKEGLKLLKKEVSSHYKDKLLTPSETIAKMAKDRIGKDMTDWNKRQPKPNYAKPKAEKKPEKPKTKKS